jgi:hypothetical protein
MLKRAGHFLPSPPCSENLLLSRRAAQNCSEVPKKAAENANKAAFFTKLS